MSKITQLAKNEIIRGNILKLLDEIGSIGASFKLLNKALTTSGFVVTREEVDRELRYLQGKNVIDIEHIENKVLGIKRDIVRINSRGIDVLEGTLQIDGIEVDEEDSE
ncbi:MAG: hypothetical protein K2N34_05755 [Lachnospiraceae bacterium]|nr:hypothetical protein [Lachnospiraceae bacterium]